MLARESNAGLSCQQIASMASAVGVAEVAMVGLEAAAAAVGWAAVVTATVVEEAVTAANSALLRSHHRGLGRLCSTNH